MIAEKAVVENTKEICPICEVKDYLPHFYKPENANICDECYLKLHQKPLPLDEYDLRPDELTKEQVADKAQVSLRLVEMWKKNGELPATKLRRRVNGIVRQQLIFNISDVEDFLNAKNEAVNLPKVEKNEIAKMNENENFLNASQMFVAENLGKFADAMNKFSDNMPKQLTAAPMGDDKARFLTVHQASEEFGLAQAEIKRLITDKVIRGFTGSKGETLVSRKQIEEL